ncbi:ABC-F family ATP-binding cassette domain-containing protein [Streptacidiphilus sp. NEAU-YB345]|uniref:ABC-F family ATP-binding cassette domain-containing protein n=2 Tax=Streptacidiphilus fuscans TaxID=2789292 RepID=A0A931B706_9ACTN|nr:ABC-F family ATP-binding cassette domain-containing protein [Streptacidiphilus fuscans]
MPAVVCTGLDYTWPDGVPVLAGLDFVVGAGCTGLIGRNGSGKSTLLRLIAGELTPEAGRIRVEGTLGYLPQQLPLAAELPVDVALGIADKRAALHAIERGEVSDENYAVIGDDWDVEERAVAELDRLGLGHLGLDRRIGELSGGEGVLLGLAGQLLRRPDVLLLDEPTNNLDSVARERLYRSVTEFRGTLVLVSHDRTLLDLVDRVAELRDHEVTWFGGNYSEYEEALAVAQEAAERDVRVAEADLRRQRRELADTQVKLARRKRFGDKMFEIKREPRAVMRVRKRTAQVSAGRLRTEHEGKVEAARERLSAAELAVRDDDEIRVDLPATEVPAGRTVLTLMDVLLQHGAAPGGIAEREREGEREGEDGGGPDGARIGLELRGPERVALVGPNGSGKTTLLRTVVGELAPLAGEVHRPVPVRYLPQRLDLLDEELSVVANAARFAPQATENALRARLARFLFRGARADQPVGTLSGGERFRATLAALMLAEPAPQVLLLDEPTNNLDLAGVRQLTTALAGYRGALIVVSHDQRFLDEIGIDREVRMERMERIDPMGPTACADVSPSATSSSPEA